MMMRVAFSFATIVLLAACGPAPNSKAPARPGAMTNLDGAFAADTGAILPENKAAELILQCGGDPPDRVQGTWLPTVAQVAAIESKLGSLLTARLRALSTSDLATPKLSEYNRQYAGLVIGRKRIICVNGFLRRILDGPNSHSLNWRAEPVLVCDGGWSFFGVEYDIDSETFGDLAFGRNGTALDFC